MSGKVKPALSEPRSLQLLPAARRAREASYSPYSHFAVGAVVETAEGRLFPGVNIENSSYGLAVCAERTAIFSAIISGTKKIVALAVSCPSTNLTVHQRMPCGACLQVMAEFATDDFEIFVDRVGRFKLADLLPRPFKLTPTGKGESL